MQEKDILTIANALRVANAEAVLPRFRNLSPQQLKTKSSVNDLVTVADREAEALIFDALQSGFIDCELIGEESYHANDDLAAILKNTDLAFIIDPIDGTWHFAHGSPSFATLVAVVSRGEVIAGVNYEPITQQYQWAIKGEGAFETGSWGTRKLQVPAQNKDLCDVIGCIPINNFSGVEQAGILEAIPSIGRSMDYLCSAMEYRLGCAGALGFHLHNGNLKCWDHAAGVLIASESGMMVAYTDGTPYDPGLQTGQLLVAESESRWHEIRDLFGLNARSN
ncbi:MAG: inositol monophosphatase [Pseudomonadales bacterium]|jgi:fructose-1,6-bisphosphatase/inositol monophosphatase family enzyme